jgi:DNA modification methylase
MPRIGDPPVLKPYWTTSDGRTVKLYLGEVREVLRRLPEKSVQCVVTSPPYWGLRDYGTGTWEGGDGECNHVKTTNEQVHRSSTLGPTAEQKSRGDYSREHPATNAAFKSKAAQYNGQCKKCGARRIDQQLGSEPSPDCGTQGKAQCGKCFVCSMVSVFREVKRVLRDDGTLWLNLGDSYCSKPARKDSPNLESEMDTRNSRTLQKGEYKRAVVDTMPSGNLVGIPWRIALALQADGWILRSDIPWVKRSPMPESVKNRPAKALEYVFMFVKKMGYYYDGEAIKKKSINPESLNGRIVRNDDKFASHDPNGKAATRSGFSKIEAGKTYPQRNFWQADLWFESVDTPHGLTRLVDGNGEEEIIGIDTTSFGYSGAHFATYPPKLIEPMIKAGTSDKGACIRCGAPWRRVIEEKQITRDRPNEYVKRIPSHQKKQNTPGKRPYSDASTLYAPHVTGRVNTCSNSVAGVSIRTVGWEPSCMCFLDSSRCCKECGADWNIEESEPFGKDWNANKRREGKVETQGQSKKDREDDEARLASKNGKVSKKEDPCKCFTSKVRPCVVLDPFIGSGTTSEVALSLNRRSIGIDLSEKYLEDNAIPRIENEIRRRPSTVDLLPD